MLRSWLELSGSTGPGAEVGGSVAGRAGPLELGGPAGEVVADLGARLLAVLDDETGQTSLIPPTAAHISQEAWDDLDETARDAYRRAQLRTLDPRLVGRTLLHRTRQRSRSDRSGRRI